MATERRMIDANVAVNYCLNRWGMNSMTEKFLNAQPTVDAVEVVRCKDCKHAGINENHPNKPLLCFMTKMCGTTKPNWFCADGERRKDK